MRGTEHFDASNLEVTTVDVGNPASNVIPAEARATFNIRFNDLWTPETLEAEIARRLREAAGNDVRYTLRCEPTNAVAFLTPPDRFVDFVADAIEAETGRRPKLSTTGGTSDARFIKDLSGGRVRPRRPDDAPGRRARRRSPISTGWRPSTGDPGAYFAA